MRGITPLPKTRGRGLFKESYASICSAHCQPIKECPLCAHGSWRNVWVGKASNLLYKLSPTIWRWQANCRWFPWTRRNVKFLEETFPNLKKP